jgi:hypothetical protein
MRTLPLAVLLLAAGLAVGVATSRGAAAAGPTLRTAPSIVGAPVVGQRLTALPGAWTASGTVSLHYQWYRCDGGVAHCGSVHGATGPSYQVVVADTGHTIALTVSATDSGGTTSAYANAVGPVAKAASPLVSVVQPVATGSVKTGLTVQVTDGAWNRKPATVTYAWQRCNANGRLCTAIAGATANTYIVTSADEGHALAALVTGASGSTTVAALSTVAGAAGGTTTTTTTTTAPKTTTTTAPTGPGPTNSAAPTISGTPAQGAKLTSTAGTWVGSGTITYHYQWYRCDTSGAHCSSIHGATGATYTLVGADVAKTIALTVAGTDAKGTTSAYASLLGPVAQAESTLLATEQPTITGTARAGQVLTATTGTWSGSPSSYNYAWQRCNANGRICAPIANATSATYTATSADAGHKVLVIVQAVAGDSTSEALSRSVLVAG